MRVSFEVSVGYFNENALLYILINQYYFIGGSRNKSDHKTGVDFSLILTATSGDLDMPPVVLLQIVVQQRTTVEFYCFEVI